MSVQKKNKICVLNSYNYELLKHHENKIKQELGATLIFFPLQQLLSHLLFCAE
jgi:hypothetical protein